MGSAPSVPSRRPSVLLNVVLAVRLDAPVQAVLGTRKRPAVVRYPMLVEAASPDLPKPTTQSNTPHRFRQRLRQPGEPAAPGRGHPVPGVADEGQVRRRRARARAQPRFSTPARRQHAAVESAINALEANGLDRCPDHCTDSFKRYVVMAVVERNLHRLGAILLAEEAKTAVKERRRQRRAA